MEKQLQVGDKLGRWTVTDVKMVPYYTYRRPMQVIDTGEMGYHYQDSDGNQWYTLGEDDEQVLLTMQEIQYID